jgi:hypothetical protein
VFFKFAESVSSKTEFLCVQFCNSDDEVSWRRRKVTLLLSTGTERVSFL